jgi:hypothetical protein
LGGYFASTVVDNKIIVIGDIKVDVEPFSFLTFQTKVLIYDPETDGWSEGKTRPENTAFINFVSAGTTTGIYAPKKVYVFGLEFSTDYSSTIQPSTWIYDPVTDSWSSAKSMSTSRTGFGASVVDDVLYIIGGLIDSEGRSSINEQYIPLGYHGTLPSGTSPPSASTVTSSHIPSEPESSKSFLTELVVVAIIFLTVGIIVIVALFYTSRKNRLLREIAKGDVT